MSDLASLIDAALAGGPIEALTVWPSGKGWQCNAKRKNGAWRCVTASAPAAGILDALTGPTTSGAVSGKTPAKADEGGVFD